VKDDVRAAVDAVMPGVWQDLKRLVRIPSVSFPGFDPSHVRESAEATADVLEAAGLRDVRLLEVEGAHPAVYGHTAGPEGSPTVLLYAHHDVQPPGDHAKWTSPPFEPTERDGRLYGRGTCDDKAGIMAHAAALRAFDGEPPVGVTVLIEGEEETGSEHLPAFLDRYSDLIQGHAVVVADSLNWRLGQPALTTSLRGLVDCDVEVRTLGHGIHSGFLGGVFPDALTVLCRLLATLHDERGRVAIPGLVAEDADPLDLTEEELRELGATVPGLQAIGEGSLTSRLWTRPAASVLAIDAPRMSEASNTLVPSARAKVSLRLPPGQDPGEAMEALLRHLREHVDWGAEVTVTPGAAAHPAAIRAEGEIFDAARAAMEEAWGKAPVDVGAGGTIPLVRSFMEALPDAAILVTGVEDPDGRAHSTDESLHIEEFERICVAEALLLRHLA
jgi:cysteinylglycine-S-conjugate dipeptidase